VYSKLDMRLVAEWQDYLATNPPLDRDDFGAAGRGESYAQAQVSNERAREIGIVRLLKLMRYGPASAGTGATRPDPATIADLLGGDGLVRRVGHAAGLANLEVVTCDASPYMVRIAQELAGPALLQRAERHLFATGSLDGVLLAYGSHHVPLELRGTVVTESYRVLAPKGTFVLHDFAVGSPADTWFSTIVDPWSSTGHRYVHYTADSIQEYIAEAGFIDCDLIELCDPYRAWGETPEAAERNLGEYLLRMYGLTRACAEFGTERAASWAADQARQIFRYPGGPETTLEPASGGWQITVPRIALVGVGRKP
jgi:SAM-dependent methyltransferase